MIKSLNQSLWLHFTIHSTPLLPPSFDLKFEFAHGDVHDVMRSDLSAIISEATQHLQCDYWNRASWSKVDQSKVYLRTKDSIFFSNKPINKIENPTKCEELRTSQETSPFVDWLV